MDRNKPASSPAPPAAKPEARSRLTNGRQTFLVPVDGRSVPARRWRDLFRQFMAETGGKNEALVRSLASLCLQRDLIDVRLAKGEPVDTQELIRVCGAISRLMSKLGLVADEPTEDATQEVISMLRANSEAPP